jgi:hypothetical protein
VIGAAGLLVAAAAVIAIAVVWRRRIRCAPVAGPVDVGEP